MDKTPLVSIVLPVYNGEKLLPIALDSMVNQTYPNIEIVAVNNSSTDGTLAILEEYAARYPQIKIYTIPHEPNGAGARKYGYEIASGDFITTCDGDDRMDIHAIEHMVDVLNKNDYDIITAPNYEIVNDRVSIVHRTNRSTVEDYMLDTNPAMWAKLIRREFYKSHEPINKDYPFEDSIYHLTVFPYAKIGYCSEPNYYYYRWATSASSSMSAERIFPFIASFDYVIEHLPAGYEEAAFFCVIRWYVNNIKSRWVVSDMLIERLKKYWPKIQEHISFFLHHEKRIYDLARLYALLPDEPMPNTVYINGFGTEKDALASRISDLHTQAFYDGCDVVVLSEENCDLSENKLVRRAYEADNWEFVGGYFALKSIYENGGVYLHRRIKLEAPLNYVRYFRSFFCRLSENFYSDSIFGGMAGNEVIKSVLDTYTETFYPDLYYLLADRINNILVSKYHVSMGNDTGIFKYPTVVFSPSVTLYPAEKNIAFTPLHFCYHDFSDKADDKNYYVMPVKLLQKNVLRPVASSGLLREKAGAYDRYKTRFEEMKKWKRFMVLYFMDRERCKEKAKKNFAPYPLIYKTAKAAYRLTHKGER